MNHIKQHSGFLFLAVSIIIVSIFISFSATPPVAQQAAKFKQQAQAYAANKQYAKAAVLYKKSADTLRHPPIKSMDYMNTAKMYLNLKDYTASLNNIILALQANSINASAYTLLKWLVSEVPHNIDLANYINQALTIENIDMSRMQRTIDIYLDRIPEKTRRQQFIKQLNEPLKKHILQLYTRNTENKHRI